MNPKSHLRIGMLLCALAAAALPACNCGGLGTPCKTAADCAFELECAPNDTCQPLGSNIGRLPDGGRATTLGGCVNLQCQQVTCPASKTTTVTGHVYDPSGTLPLYNAVVYVPNGTVQPFTEGVTCDRCGALTTGSPLAIGLSGADGAFTLTNVPAGPNIPLVIQLGKWRRQVVLPSVTPCATNALSDVNQQRLPRSRAEGDLPQFAIATGQADPFECLLLKVGIDPAEFTVPSQSGSIHVYQENGVPLATGTPAASQLWSDAGTLSRYDVVLLPCEGGEHSKPAAATQNVIDYTSLGGRVFATHYSYVWTAFAQQPFPATADWEPNPATSSYPPDPFAVSVDTSFPKGQALFAWLSNVGALDAGFLDLTQARHDVISVNADAGTSRWLYGTVPDSGKPDSVQELTFNTPVFPPPAPDGGPGVQCGRVVFTDFHVTTDALTDAGVFPASCRAGPLTPQEKALLFMLFDISSCVQSDTVAPSVCNSVGKSCSTTNPCCSGLVCVDSDFNPCTGGASCMCAPTVN